MASTVPLQERVGVAHVVKTGTIALSPPPGAPAELELLELLAAPVTPELLPALELPALELLDAAELCAGSPLVLDAAVALDVAVLALALDADEYSGGLTMLALVPPVLEVAVGVSSPASSPPSLPET